MLEDRIIVQDRGIDAGPVSYTHLDVYKRQLQILLKTRYCINSIQGLYL